MLLLWDQELLVPIPWGWAVGTSALLLGLLHLQPQLERLERDFVPRQDSPHPSL